LIAHVWTFSFHPGKFCYTEKKEETDLEQNNRVHAPAPGRETRGRTRGGASLCHRGQATPVNFYKSYRELLLITAHHYCRPHCVIHKTPVAMVAGFAPGINTKTFEQDFTKIWKCPCYRVVGKESISTRSWSVKESTMHECIITDYNPASMYGVEHHHVCQSSHPRRALPLQNLFSNNENLF